MCGICGVLSLRPGLLVREEILRGMADALRHRGPDDEGYYREGEIGLGHRRLSIIDVEGGRQPLSNEDETIWITYNGEVYNFKILRERLKEKGHSFRTLSDTEVIVHLYEEIGEDFLKELRGMFAFGLWDGKKKRLILARDRIGIKPLYYMHDGEKVIFASEIKGILAYPGIKREVNLRSLCDYLSFLCVPSPRTMFQGIRKLPPAHLLIVEKGRAALHTYWDLPLERREPEEEKSEEVLKEEFRSLLREAVQMRLISEVPLGAFLSGGIDSSSVVAVMAELCSERPITTSVGFDEKAFDELSYARRVASQFELDHREYVVRPEALEVLDRLVWHFDEPFADPSAVPTYYLSAMARERVTVALSGDGGDEAFLGYRRYFFELLENRLRPLFSSPLLRRAVALLAKCYPKADWLPQVFRGKTLLSNLSSSEEQAYFNSVSPLSPLETRNLLSPGLHREIGDYSPIQTLERFFQRGGFADPLARAQYVDIKTSLVDDILTKVDRMSMAHSLEVRVPFLDHKMVEFGFSLPLRWKLRGRQGKYLVKRAMKGRLPREILSRSKKGFDIPLKRWFRGEIREMAREVLLEGEDPFFCRKRVEEIWELHQKGVRDYSLPLWALLMFRLWHKKFIQGGGPVEGPLSP